MIYPVAKPWPDEVEPVAHPHDVDEVGKVGRCLLWSGKCHREHLCIAVNWLCGDRCPLLVDVSYHYPHAIGKDALICFFWEARRQQCLQPVGHGLLIETSSELRHCLQVVWPGGGKQIFVERRGIHRPVSESVYPTRGSRWEIDFPAEIVETGIRSGEGERGVSGMLVEHTYKNLMQQGIFPARRQLAFRDLQHIVEPFISKGVHHVWKFKIKRLLSVKLQECKFR